LWHDLKWSRKEKRTRRKEKENSNQAADGKKKSVCVEERPSRGTTGRNRRRHRKKMMGGGAIKKKNASRCGKSHAKTRPAKRNQGQKKDVSTGRTQRNKYPDVGGEWNQYR